MYLVIIGLIFLFGTEYDWWTAEQQVVSDTVMYLVGVILMMTGLITSTIETVGDKIISAIKGSKTDKSVK